MIHTIFIGPRLYRDGPIGSYGEELTHPKQIAIIAYINEYLSNIQSKDNYCVISSLTAGIEQWSVSIAQSLNIPTIIKLPHDGFTDKMPDFVKAKINLLLSNAVSVETISSGEWSIDKMRVKDAQLCKDADTLISFYERDIKEMSACRQTTEIIRPFRQPAPISPPPIPSGKNSDYFIPF